MLALWFTCAWMYLLAHTLTCAVVYTHGNEIPSRTRRAISGTPVLDLNSEYGSVRYVVWMSSGHNCERLSSSDVKKLIEAEGKNKDITIDFTSCAPNPQNNLCAGSLLTPTLVQTACHCLVRFEGEFKNGFWKAVTLRVWEDMYDIYPGIVPVKNVKGVKAKHYISHPKCAEHNLTRRIFHDYGLIVLRNSVKASGIRYAPVYTIQGLFDIWTGIMAKNSVCLNVGFGRYRLLKNNKTNPTLPPELLHGWIEVMDYIECYNYSNSEVQWFNYSDATWFCTKEIPSMKQHQGKGDSGGPVTCNNHYAGVTSFSHSLQPLNEYSYSGSSSTAFSIFENSAEFREALNNIAHMYEKYNSKAKIFNYRPTAPQIYQYYS